MPFAHAALQPVEGIRMSRLHLTSWQRRRLRRQLAQTLDARLLRRTLAVLEFDSGRPVAEIADPLGVTRQSVYNWVQAYRHGRDPAALQDAEGRGRPPGVPPGPTAVRRHGPP